MRAARIGVVVPYFQDRPGLLQRALASVVAQVGVPEVFAIIVDDGSPCPARAELRGMFRSEAIPDWICLIEQKNAGVSSARNRALDEMPADIDYVAFLDSDDVWRPNHLQTAVFALEQGFDFYFADHRREGQSVTRFEECGLTSEMGTPLPYGCNLFRYDGDLFSQLVRKSPVGTPTVVLRAKIIAGLRFQEDLSANEDALFWLCVQQRGARTAYSIDQDVDCGVGVNIYAGGVWGASENLKVLSNICRYHRRLPAIITLSKDLNMWNQSWRRQVRRDFVMNLLHILRRGRSIDWRLVEGFIRDEPLVLLELPAVFLVALRNRILAHFRVS